MRIRGIIPVVAGVVLGALFTHGLRAQVVINELLAENVFDSRDEDGDSSDWVELKNAGDETVVLDGWLLSDDLAIVGKWRLPRVDLEPGGLLVVWCSGKDRELPPPERIVEPNSRLPLVADLVEEGATWRYLSSSPQSGETPPGWTSTDFDDAGWSEVTLPIGFGEPGLSTELDRTTGTILLRAEFTVAALESLAGIVFETRYDDGIVVWLNGIRVISSNVAPDDSPGFGSVAESHHPPVVRERFDLGPWLRDGTLQAGANVLAIAVVNRTPGRDTGSNDAFFVGRLGHVPRMLHSSFRLGSGGEALTLADPRGVLVDALLLPEQTADRSYGRSVDRPERLVYHLRPTRGAPNDTLVSSDVIPERPTFSPSGGKLAEPSDVRVSMALPFDDVTLRYTLDGSPPSGSSPVYTEPVLVSRNMVIRSAAFIGEERVSHVETQSYFLTAWSFGLPILSVAMPPGDFRDVHLDFTRRGRESEKVAHVELVDADGVRLFGVGTGMRLHGNAGREGGIQTKKSYRLYFRGDYGTPRLEYPLIPDAPGGSLDVVVLRASTHDSFRTISAATLIRDEIIRSLHGDMGAAVSHGAWCNLFVNMEYRGLYNATERIGTELLAANFPEDGEEWDVAPTDDLGLWLQLLEFVREHDFTEDALADELARRVHVDNIIDYMTVNIWCQNHDWPGNNWFTARPRRSDGKWIFLTWDVEAGMGGRTSGFTANSLENVYGNDSSWLVEVFLAVVENPRFERRFIETFLRHMDGVLHPEHVLARVREIAVTVAPDMHEETQRARQTFTRWEANVAFLETFAARRSGFIGDVVLRSTRFRTPRFTRAMTRRVFPDGVVDVRLRGIGFPASFRVRFNGMEALGVRVEDGLVVAGLPFDLRMEGRPDVTLVEPSGRTFTSSGLFEVTLRPQPESIDPVVGPSAGGIPVSVFGRNFRPGARVFFGEREAVSTEAVGKDGTELLVVAPSGAGTVAVRVANTRPGWLPAFVQPAFTYERTETFRRGDVDGDDRRNVRDAVLILRTLVGAVETSACEDALDVDDSGRVDLADAIGLLSWLFDRGDSPPSPPHSECGIDPTEDALACSSMGRCGG